MASSGSSLFAEAQALIAKLKTLINQELKEICKKEGLQVSGVKAVLQERIINLINDVVRRSDAAAFTRVRYRIHNHGQTPPAVAGGSGAAPTSSSAYNNSPAYTSSPQTPRAGQQPGASNPYSPMAHPPRPLYQTHIRFRPSPFFKTLEPLAPTQTLPIIRDHRQTSTLYLTLSPHHAGQLNASGGRLRVMLYCAGEPPNMNYSTPTDIAFPQQLEIRVGNIEVKGNFKGLKNKPGSTRPADITNLIEPVAGRKHTITIHYALTQKRFYLVPFLVQRSSVEQLCESIKNGQRISKNTVLGEMRTKANDPDIVATAYVMSLKDPVSTLRIGLPIRSTVCNHNRCFDATGFLQLQEQAPTWTCPICNKYTPFEQLAVDEYVLNILESTSKSIDQVTVEPDGKWSLSSNNATHGRNDYESDSDDDLVEITDFRKPAVKTESPATSFSFAARTPAASREASTAGSGGGAGTKRKSEVIDLTLSDDDDPRPAKRPAYGTPQSMPDTLRNGYRQPPPPNSTNPNPHSSGVANGFVPFRVTTSHHQQGHHNQPRPHGGGLSLPPHNQHQQGQQGQGHGSPSVQRDYLRALAGTGGYR